MQDEDEKDLSRMLRDLRDENERLRIENKTPKKVIKSFSVKPASFATIEETN